MILIDAVKEYWDRQPCNIKHSSAPIGSKQYFDEVEERKYFVEPHIKEFAAFEQWKGKRVLEVGCGIGTDAINFCRAGANYIGIDLSFESVSIANKRIELENFAPKCYVWNIEDPLISYIPADLIYSFGVLHHTVNPHLALRNIRHVIKPDGELRIMLYAMNSWKAIMVNAGLDHYENQNGCPIVWTYNYQLLENLLKDFFEITSIKQTHIFPYCYEEYRNYKYVVQPYFQTMSPAMFHALERELGQHLLITAKPR